MVKKLNSRLPTQFNAGNIHFKQNTLLNLKKRILRKTKTIIRWRFTNDDGYDTEYYSDNNNRYNNLCSGKRFKNIIKDSNNYICYFHIIGIIRVLILIPNFSMRT